MYVAQVAQHLARLGFEVDVFTRRDDAAQAEVVDWKPGLRVVHVPAGHARIIPKEELAPLMGSFAGWMKEFINRQGGYDLVHANFWMSGLVAADLKADLQIPFAITFHALGRVRQLHQGANDRFPADRVEGETELMQAADRIIAECPQDRIYQIQLYGADPVKIRMVPCGFDASEFQPMDRTLARRAIGCDPDEKLVVHIGRMVRRKGVDNATRGYGAPRRYTMSHAFYGPSYGDEEIEAFLQWSKLPYRKLTNLADETAEILVQDKVIGWFQGRMEFGPGALGGRSILASPIHAEMQARLNDIKDREDFRPVAPVVLEEEAKHWFINAGVAPFMLFIFDVLPEKAEHIPAVRYVDGTARVQTINRDQNAAYYDLLKAFERRTGVPVLINTSFNTRGEPIVCTPRDAVESFWTSPLDALVIGSFLLEKPGRMP